jgi:hypothetical protein
VFSSVPWLTKVEKTLNEFKRIRLVPREVSKCTGWRESRGVEGVVERVASALFASVPGLRKVEKQINEFVWYEGKCVKARNGWKVG